MTAKEATERVYYDCWTSKRFNELMSEFSDEVKLLTIKSELSNNSGSIAFAGVNAIVTLDGIENEAGD